MKRREVLKLGFATVITPLIGFKSENETHFIDPELIEELGAPLYRLFAGVFQSTSYCGDRVNIYYGAEKNMLNNSFMGSLFLDNHDEIVRFGPFSTENLGPIDPKRKLFLVDDESNRQCTTFRAEYVDVYPQHTKQPGGGSRIVSQVFGPIKALE